MPWCPKCKTEYREGITSCVDCGSELMNEQPEEFEYTLLCTLENDEIAEKLRKYFEYSGIVSYYEYDEKELGYSVYVKEDELKKAKKSFQAFYAVELEALSKADNSFDNKASDDGYSDDKDLKDEEFSEEDFNDDNLNDEGFSKNLDSTSDDNFDEALDEAWEEQPNRKTTTAIPSEEQKNKIAKMMYEGGAYEKKADKVKDLRSTTTTFFLFGFVGIAFILLNLFGVIDFIGGTLQYILMSAMFVGFLLVGVNSMQRAKKVSKEAIQEEETSKAIIEYLDAAATSNVIEALKDSSFSEEGNFIRVMEGLKALVVSRFGELDDAYLDYITEEFYNSRYEEDSEDYIE